MVDEGRLDKQRTRQSDEGSQRTEDPAPQQQGDKGHRRSQADGVTRELRLNDGLDDEVEHGISDDHSKCRNPTVAEESQQGRRDDTDDEADVRDVVRQEAEQRPHPGKRDTNDEQGRPVEERNDETEHRRDEPVLANTAGKGLEGDDDVGFPLTSQTKTIVHLRGVHDHEDHARQDDDDHRHHARGVRGQGCHDRHHLLRINLLEFFGDDLLGVSQLCRPRQQLGVKLLHLRDVTLQLGDHGRDGPRHSGQSRRQDDDDDGAR